VTQTLSKRFTAVINYHKIIADYRVIQWNIVCIVTTRKNKWRRSNHFGSSVNTSYFGSRRLLDFRRLESSWRGRVTELRSCWHGRSAVLISLSNAESFQVLCIYLCGTIVVHIGLITNIYADTCSRLIAQTYRARPISEPV